MTSYYDYIWGEGEIDVADQTNRDQQSKKRRVDEINDKISFVESDNIYTYAVGNEIHFSSPITLESIQKIIKEIQKLVHAHVKKTGGQSSSSSSSSNKLTISITIDSPGGSVMSILKYVDFVNRIRKKYKNIEFVSIITGFAASAGTIMALCADKRCITKNAHAMIHELSAGNQGKYTFLSSHMEFLDKLHEKLVNIYVEATGKPREELENLMKRETWFTAEEYKKLGFVTEII